MVRSWGPQWVWLPLCPKPFGWGECGAQGYVGLALPAPADPPAVHIEPREVVLRQGDSVNLTCHISADPPATADWVLPKMGPELLVVTKASSDFQGYGQEPSQQQ